MSEVVGCSEAEIETCVTEFKEHLGSPEAARRFLLDRKLSPPASASVVRAPSDRPRAQEPLNKGAKAALDMLEFWTSRWLEDYESEEEEQGTS